MKKLKIETKENIVFIFFLSLWVSALINEHGFVDGIIIAVAVMAVGFPIIHIIIWWIHR